MFIFLKIVQMEHFLAMVYAMMKQTMLNASLMEEIVVELVSTQSIVHNVFVMMKQNQCLIFHVSSFLLIKVIINLMNKESYNTRCLEKFQLLLFSVYACCLYVDCTHCSSRALYWALRVARMKLPL